MFKQMVMVEGKSWQGKCRTVGLLLSHIYCSSLEHTLRNVHFQLQAKSHIEEGSGWHIADDVSSVHMVDGSCTLDFFVFMQSLRFPSPGAH